MRKIEFRFYGVNAEKMYYLSEKEKFTSNVLIATEDWKVMQFTGLYDKNGTKIFEGDIIKRIDSNIKYIVVFNRGNFCTQDSKNLHHNLNLLDSISDYSEVIGNIHQNKELLEE